MNVRPEITADHEAVRHLNQAAFGQEGEGKLIDELRAGGYTHVSLVAEDDGQIIGHILFSELPIQTPTGVVSALALAPMASYPATSDGESALHWCVKGCGWRKNKDIASLSSSVTSITTPGSDSRRRWPNRWTAHILARHSWPWSWFRGRCGESAVICSTRHHFRLSNRVSR